MIIWDILFGGWMIGVAVGMLQLANTHKTAQWHRPAPVRGVLKFGENG